MKTTYDIDNYQRVVPIIDGRRENCTRAYRDATELELQQQARIAELEYIIHDAIRIIEPEVESFGERRKSHRWYGELRQMKEAVQ